MLLQTTFFRQWIPGKDSLRWEANELVAPDSCYLHQCPDGQGIRFWFQRRQKPVWSGLFRYFCGFNIKLFSGYE
jgi:hypothetical protein